MDPELANVMIVVTYIASVVCAAVGKRIFGVILYIAVLVMILFCDGAVAEFLESRWIRRILSVIFLLFFVDSEMKDHLM